jgi:tRNA (cmo5U34)-methyltransferase
VKNGDRFLDIGAGTGNLTRAILEKIDSVHATLIDFSANMLTEVPNILSQFKGRYDIVVADFMEEEFPENTYSAVVSSYAIHHCRGEQQYLALYKKIRSSLKGTGIFVCCDVVSGSDELLSHQNELGWASFLKDRGFSTDEVDKVLSNYHVEDSPESVWTHMRLLKEAGFTTVDVIWRKYNFSVYVGISD